MTAGKTTTPVKLTRAHRILISVVVAGAVTIAGIGFAGSYAAVRELAVQKGFGSFSYFFPIGIDAGICVLLALDLLLTWIRIPFPLLRQTAWLLTAATIAFNGAAAWPDPLGVGMHAVIPMLFVVAVEAARHAIGRIADITADKHMEGVRLTRWLLSPGPTFMLWRRMKLWEIRSYEHAVKLEQHRLVYEAQLQARFGRRWRRKAPVADLMPLRLAKYGIPLADTAPRVLEEAGLDLAAATVERADVPAAIPQTDADQAKQEPGADPLTAAAPQQLDLPAMDYAEACRAFVAAAGVFPDADQFALFLAQSYGVTDPDTGGPLDEAPLEKVLADLRHALAETVADHRAGPTAPEVADGRLADAGHLSSDPHPFIGTAAPHAAEAPTEQVPEPVASALATGHRGSGGGVPQQRPLGIRAEPAVVETAILEATVPETGAATARVPQQQLQEADLDPREQQIVVVAQWIDEAEAVGQKLSGAEVGRRLGVAPRTGQRRLDTARVYREEQRRQQGRAHLRSVSH